MNDFKKAERILREKCPIETCANMLANYCEKKNMKEKAIEFHIMAGKRN
jgi:hypothetical protein